MKTKPIRVICIGADGTTVVAEWRSANVANAQRRAQWMLDNVPGATWGAVPFYGYEVTR